MRTITISLRLTVIFRFCALEFSVFRIDFSCDSTMAHHVERDLQGASHLANQARGEVVEARELQKTSHVLRVCVLLGMIIIIIFLLFIFFESDLCYSLSIC
ncbi:unnamed protein product [Caenorhabditis brenneri]